MLVTIESSRCGTFLQFNGYNEFSCTDVDHKCDTIGFFSGTICSVLLHNLKCFSRQAGTNPDQTLACCSEGD